MWFIREVKISRRQQEQEQERNLVVFVTFLYTKSLRFQNNNKNLKATQQNAMNKIVTQNNTSEICNNIPFCPLCFFDLFLKCWQSYFQSFSVWKKSRLRWTTCRFHFVVYYNDDEEEPRKNTRNDDVSTQKFCSRSRCRSEILTSLLFSLKHLSALKNEHI